ncbi:NAD-dependent protein deacylase [Bacillus sp. ISL-35]|uniref:NAD-dependent protein deacylase n=1 Tax=Bacillus sp. ISL-35 TaxID=2819122 RepID=UPI001BEC71B0|nr:NAD-dependent protein deacylase [Bacillus sp. ISL-35]MBT2679447.1 NAD-dependent protein deacylase [Bacillus sp. ISL-35]MBT2703350.1 NAD-dependent protein deacylase [Chryseobacterium sp. ISL-80]
MDTIQSCSEIVANSKNIVVLTGAGISTESGIKDFRSRTGIYHHAPEYILSIDYFHEQPKSFYEFAFSNLYHPNALPNKGHQILAKWEQEGRIDWIITQNIDGLHQKAGSKKVIEFHGTMKTATCQNCGKKYTSDDLLIRKQTDEKFFVCRECEADQDFSPLIKPDVVLFGDAGEWFTAGGFEKILNRIAEADCLVILGTSLKVTPFSAFPQYKNNDTPMIIINKGDTPYDFAPDTFVIRDSIGRTLSEIDSYLNK